MLRDLISSVVVMAVLPVATESAALADMMSDSPLQPVRRVRLKREVEGNTLLLCSLLQSERGKEDLVLWRSTLSCSKLTDISRL